MDPNVISAIIGASSALIGSAAGGYATYMSVQQQIKAQHNIEENKRREQKELAESILMTFLFDEMRTNYMELHSNDHFNKLMHENDKPQQWNYVNQFKLKFVEFDHVKYDLLRHNTKYVEDVLELYNAFRLIADREQEISAFTQDDYNRMRKSYLIFEEVFYGKNPQ
jgi:hypothetical protein